MVVIALVLCAASVMGGESGKEQAALEAATRWLVLVDSEKYADSWTQASEFFKSSIEQEEWELMVQAARRPLVTLKQRKIVRSTYETSLPGAPNGEYVVMQFRSLFLRRPVIETVTASRENDGVWRVCGYYIN